MILRFALRAVLARGRWAIGAGDGRLSGLKRGSVTDRMPHDVAARRRDTAGRPPTVAVAPALCGGVAIEPRDLHVRKTGFGQNPAPLSRAGRRIGLEHA